MVSQATAAEADHRKLCTLCSTPRDVLVRCQIDATGSWHFVCPSTCWRRVSGGVIDGDGSTEHEWYRYGGMWKNKHEAVSAKKPKKKVVSEAQQGIDDINDKIPAWAFEEEEEGVWYTKNDKVRYQDIVYVCRKSHESDEKHPPNKTISTWKEA